MADLQTRVEKVFSSAQFISFAIESKDAVLNFMWDKHHYKDFSKRGAFGDVIKYFKGRKMKFIIVFRSLGMITSFVDIETGDALNFTGPKFINGNIHKFLESKVSTDRVFKLIAMGKSSDNSTLVFPSELMANPVIEIHGYSLTDKRSS